MLLDKKILALEKFIAKAQALKKEGQKIVTYNGSFDIIHIGHIRSIQEAKEQGDVLLVFVNSDESIHKYKGPTRPLIDEKNRLAMVAGIEGVDYVTLFDDINPKHILEQIKPDVHCNGSDWGKECVERAVVEENGGKIHILSWEKGFSTSNLIKKILHVYQQPMVKAVFLDKDGTIHENKEGYIYKKEDFEFTPQALTALQKLSKTDYKIIIITNQSGIAKGKYTEKTFHEFRDWIIAMLAKEGVRIDAVYYCPHDKQHDCDCRKPKIGMFLQAVKDFGISLNDSWFIGDEKRDIMAGREANIKTIKLGGNMPEELKLEPNFYAKDLLHGIEIVMSSDK